MRQARTLSWVRGDLWFKRHPTQQRIHEAIRNTASLKFFLLCSRRLGKSYELVLTAFEYAIQHPGARIVYLAPWAKNAAEIADDLAAQILIDCPHQIRPDYKAQYKEYHFPNGSIIRLRGVNGEHAQYLRGGAADLVILDECGLMDDLQHIVADVVAPMTMTTKGRILFATTPARSPGHESYVEYTSCADIGATSVFTLRDAPHVDHDTKLQYLIAAGEEPAHAELVLKGGVLPKTTTARREYFCEWVTDADSAVVPEFTEDARREICVEYERPPYFDAYVSMDPGFQDKTGVLFAYWDFMKRRLVIEDEGLLHRATTPDIAAVIKDKENANWKDHPPALRVSDIDLRLIADLWQLHGLRFSPIDKQDSAGAINLMRVMVKQREIVILPKCTNLIRQLKDAVWDSRAKDFDHSEKDAHYDLVAALKYLCRAINKNKNPYPDWWAAPGPGVWVSPKRAKRQDPGLLGDTPFGKRILKGGKTAG